MRREERGESNNRKRESINEVKERRERERASHKRKSRARAQCVQPRRARASLSRGGLGTRLELFTNSNAARSPRCTSSSSSPLACAHTKLRQRAELSPLDACDQRPACLRIGATAFVLSLTIYTSHLYGIRHVATRLFGSSMNSGAAAVARVREILDQCDQHTTREGARVSQLYIARMKLAKTCRRSLHSCQFLGCFKCALVPSVDIAQVARRNSCLLVPFSSMIDGRASWRQERK